MTRKGKCDLCYHEAKPLYTSIDPNTGRVIHVCDRCDRRLADIRLWRQLQKPEKVKL